MIFNHGSLPLLRELLLYKMSCSWIFWRILELGIVLLLVSEVKGDQQNDQKADSSKSVIYGVRWRMGNAFNIDDSLRNSEYYELSFNSQQYLNTQTYVRFGNNIYTCTVFHYALQEFDTYIYHCLISQVPKKPFFYRICTGITKFIGHEDHTHIEPFNESVLFQGKLNINLQSSSILVLGDVFAEQNGTIPYEFDQLIEDQNISIVMIGNPFQAYGLDSYENTLRQLQPITSKLVVIPVTGNASQPESILNELTFPFSISSQHQSYTTIWLKELNFTLFLVNPDVDHTRISAQISSKLKHKISSSFVILASSEPISVEESLLYKELGADIFLSIGSYSKDQRCWKDNLEQETTTKECPYFVNEGNLEGPQNGFGIIKRNSSSQLTMAHYSQFFKTDQLFLDNSQPDQTDSPQSLKQKYKIIHKVFIGLEYLALLIIVAFIGFTIISFLKANRKQQQSKKKDTNHIELVEQIVGNQTL